MEHWKQSLLNGEIETKNEKISFYEEAEKCWKNELQKGAKIKYITDCNGDKLKAKITFIKKYVEFKTIDEEERLDEEESQLKILEEMRIEEAAEPFGGLGMLEMLEDNLQNQIKTLDLSSPQYYLIEDYSKFSALLHLKELDLTGHEIKDLSPLRHLSNLEKLVISHANLRDDFERNKIEDLSPLRNLSKLKYLNLANNQIKNIDPLSELKNLEFLNLIQNEISDISPISKLTNLKYLNLWNNNIKDLSPLKNLKNLEILYLASNDISNVSSLPDLPHLSDLDLSQNPISRITQFHILSSMKMLRLCDCQLTDISGLDGLINLKYLDLSNNKDLVDLSPIEFNWLSDLRELDIRKTSVPLDQIESIQNTLKHRRAKVLHRFQKKKPWE